MTPIDIRLEGVSKQYRRDAQRHGPAFWALEDVSLEIARGSATGVIGRNGAGKSTLLKLLAGITSPSRGRITVDGRLAALIEVGSGFHPELTGRENIFLSGAILGMKRRDIQAKLSHIVEFAGVSDFIDMPVKWYSSGMYVRLGFSIAAHLDPDILLVDEVLAVGDAEFQLKCIQRVRDLQAAGVTIVLISHDLTAVEQLCDRAVLLERGRVASVGSPAAVVADYHRRLTSTAAGGDDAVSGGGDEGLRVSHLRIAPGHGAPDVRTGDPLTITLHFSASRPLRVCFELSYYSADGRTVVARTTAGRDQGAPVAPPGGAIEFTCAVLPLPPGSYYLGAVARDVESGHVVAWWDGGTMLHVLPGIACEGQMLMPHHWRLIDGSGSRSAAPPVLALATTDGDR